MRATTIIVLLTFVGCGSAPQTPFDVYQSPMLANNISAKKPNARTFDPTKAGDFPTKTEETVVASTQKSDNIWRAKKAAPKSKTPMTAKSTPSLSATRFDVKMVTEMLGANKVELGQNSNTAAGLYKHCKAQNSVHFRPKALAGDVVFFHNTADVNRDGRNNDWYSLVGVVTSVDEHQTATFISYYNGRLQEGRLNLLNPDVSTVGEQTLNTRLRDPSPDAPPYTQYHSGELFAGFCNLLGSRKDFKMFEAWTP